ncbi:hypothetical protein TNCV_3986291 [Trichonephila clavipes]|nr:hypothetical protein TNCV_3986291 [Trichonephila clavipes]
MDWPVRSIDCNLVRTCLAHLWESNCISLSLSLKLAATGTPQLHPVQYVVSSVCPTVGLMVYITFTFQPDRMRILDMLAFHNFRSFLLDAVKGCIRQDAGHNGQSLQNGCVDCLPGNSSSRHNSKATSNSRSRCRPRSSFA